MRPSRGLRRVTKASVQPPTGWALLLVGFLLLAVALGGGHIQGPIRNGLIESVGLGVLVALAVRQANSPFLPNEAKGVMLMFAALLLAFLVQLVPLPWPALPGREATDAVTALLPQAHHWRPLSLDPSSTARFALSLSVPLVAFLLTLASGSRGRILAIRSIALMAGASALLGMVQLALGFPAWSSPFGLPDSGIADGLFVNRNHQAMFLLCGLIASGLWIRLDDERSPFRVRAGRWRVHAAWLLFPLLAVMVIAAASKAGIGLLVLILPLSTTIALVGGNARSAAIRPWALLLVALGVIAVIVAFMIPSATMDVVRARLIFQGGQGDARLIFFPDLVVLLRQAWPIGTGAGTFVAEYKLIEDLDKLGPAYLNHAHNEYIEWLIEMGLAGLVLLVAGVGLIIGRAIMVMRSSRSPSRKWSAVGGFAMLAVLALHSAIDYPLRTDALAAVAGVALALLFAPTLEAAAIPPETAARQRRRKLSWSSAALILLALAMSGQAIRLRLAEVAAGDANAGLAAAIATRDGSARAYLAEAMLAGNQPAVAREIALQAINDTPLSVVAVRTLASAEMQLGHQSRARDAWRAAAGLGWRDQPTQYWAMRQALADHELATAGMRADALLRLDGGYGPFGSLVRLGLVDPALRDALVARTQFTPVWRRALLSPGRAMMARELNGVLPFLAALQRSSSPPIRGEVHDTILALLNLERYNEAIALDAPFARQRQADPMSLLDDGGFNRSDVDYRGNNSPFDWTIGDVGGSAVSLDRAGTNVMVISADGTSSQSPLVRYAALHAGRYVISYRMRGPADAAASVGFVLYCSTRMIAQSPPNELVASGFNSRSFTFDVPVDCPVVRIGLGSLPNAQQVEAEFDDVRLWPASTGAATTRAGTR